MTRKTKVNLKNTCLALSCIVTVVFFLREIGGSFAESSGEGSAIGFLILMLWVTGPYLLFWLVTYLLERYSSVPQVPGIGFGVSILIVLYAFAVYFQPLNHESSTEGLIFIFAPLWLYITVLPLLGFCLLISWVSNRQIANEAKDKPNS
jgi:chromate transport protein ChrA